jgi:hypothetical protein
MYLDLKELCSEEMLHKSLWDEKATQTLSHCLGGTRNTQVVCNGFLETDMFVFSLDFSSFACLEREKNTSGSLSRPTKLMVFYPQSG